MARRSPGYSCSVRPFGAEALWKCVLRAGPLPHVPLFEPIIQIYEPCVPLCGITNCRGVIWGLCKLCFVSSSDFCVWSHGASRVHHKFLSRILSSRRAPLVKAAHRRYTRCRTLRHGSRWIHIPYLVWNSSEGDAGSPNFDLIATDPSGSAGMQVTLIVTAHAGPKVGIPLVTQLQAMGPTSSPPNIIVYSGASFSISFDPRDFHQHSPLRRYTPELHTRTMLLYPRGLGSTNQASSSTVQHRTSGPRL
ncbi:hypothetical protein BDW66DRAFT_67239 [Aspergillus desertorum]